MDASIQDDSDDLHRSAAEQAALRRVATLVARGAARTQVYEALVTELGLLIPATDSALVQLHGDETVTMIGRWNRADGYQDIGVVHPFGYGTLARLIWESQRPSRIISYTGAPGSLAEMIRGWGWRSSVGAPVIVDGHVWGLTAVGSTTDQSLPPGTEEQLALLPTCWLQRSPTHKAATSSSSSPRSRPPYGGWPNSRPTTRHPVKYSRGWSPRRRA